MTKMKIINHKLYQVSETLNSTLVLSNTVQMFSLYFIHKIIELMCVLIENIFLQVS